MTRRAWPHESNLIEGGVVEGELLVGVDWDSRGYEVCLLNTDGQVLQDVRVDHQAESVAEFIADLLQRVRGDSTRIVVGIETPRGALVEGLLEQQIAVHAINPKQFDRLRDRHRVSGAKDDPVDAFILGDSLRHDRHLFHHVQPDHPLVIELREVVRADEELGQEFIRLSNRLREQLHRTHPHLLQLGSDLTDRWVWDLVETLLLSNRPRTRLRDLTRLLEQYRIRRLQAEDVLRIIEQPALRVSPGTTNAVRVQLSLLLPRLRLVEEQRRSCAQRMKQLLEAYGQETSSGKVQEPSTLEILDSLPGIGLRVCSTMIAEASHQLASPEAARYLRSYGGAAPVTRRSGKRVLVLRRYACNQRLQNAFFHWSRTSIQRDPHARAHYAAQRARGHSHGRALRSVTDRWLRILCAMLETRTLYDPSRLKIAKQPPVEIPEAA